MAFDYLRRPLYRNRFDYIRIQRSLNQKIDITDFVCLFLKYFDELVSDDFSFPFGIGDTGKFTEETFTRGDTDYIQLHLFAKTFENLVKFVFSQQTIIDKYTGQTVTNCFVNQRCCDGGIDSA